MSSFMVSSMNLAPCNAAAVVEFPTHSWPGSTPRGADVLDVPAAATAKATASAPKRGQLTTWPAIKEFLFAGQAMFTLVSLKTGLRFTYKVRAKKQDVEELARRTAAGEIVTEDFVCYFVNLLRGPDNTADFAYLGVLRKPGRFFTTPKSRITQHPASYKALVWFIEALKADRQDVLGKQIEFWHTGRCGVCGRLLTVPSSVATGIGPVCDGR